jgi:hypothetical protein
MSDKLYMVFDVESVGLHGEGFAVGWTIIDTNGTERGHGMSCCEISEAIGDDEGREWVTENVLPTLDLSKGTSPTPKTVRQVFWQEWSYWKKYGAQLVTDCGWPVEANFLSACVADEPDERRWNGPYPLLDLSSVLLAAGKDPNGTFERLPNELPAHNPLCDARQSARVLIETLNELA